MNQRILYWFKKQYQSWVCCCLRQKLHFTWLSFHVFHSINCCKLTSCTMIVSSWPPPRDAILGLRSFLWRGSYPFLRIVHIPLSLFLLRLFVKTLWLWLQSSNQSNHGIMFWNCWLNLDEVLIIFVYDKMIVCNVPYPCQWKSLWMRGRPPKKSCQKTFFMQWS